MFRRMLVPLDGSDLAETAIPYAKELGGRLDLDIFVLHAYDRRYGDQAPMHQAYAERAAEQIRRQLRAFHEQGELSTSIATITVRAESVVGNPAEMILQFTDKHQIDLILMATHGYSGIKRWSPGSIAAKVLHASNIPVWLVPAGSEQELTFDQWPSKTIIVPLDGSEMAEAMLPHVESLAKQWHGELISIVLVQVCDSPFVTADYHEANVAMNWESHMENVEYRFKQISEQYLARTEGKLRDAGMNVRFKVLIGKTAGTIIDYAHENPFSIIAMSSHGRSGLMRWAYGNIADKIVHGASCPVLLIKSS